MCGGKAQQPGPQYSSSRDSRVCAMQLGTCARSGPLHGWQPLSSSLQPKDSQYLSWQKEGAQRHCQLYHQWGGQKGLRHWGQVRWWPGSPQRVHSQSHLAALQPVGNGGNRRALHAPKTWVHSPYSRNEKKKKLGIGAECHLWWPRSCAWPNHLLPICDLLSLPPLTHSLACLPAMPICPKHPIPILFALPVAYRGHRNAHIWRNILSSQG
jgi:hypothetical protein